MPVIEVRHPLVKHKIGLLREVDISTKKFRELTAELARFLTYEACRDFELERCTLQGWAGEVEIDQIKGKKGHRRADPARRSRHARRRAGSDPERQGQRRRDCPQS
jgi:hypothetical protein